MGTAGNTDFAAVSAVCSLPSRLTVPYWIAGGWAVDLAVGRVTRDHADVDVMLLERDKRALWDLHRRGTYRVKRPIADITRHRDGIPFLAPEVVLLFKARSKADKDQHDVETALPVLDAGQRSWLQETLKRLPQGRTAAVPHR